MGRFFYRPAFLLELDNKNSPLYSAQYVEQIKINKLRLLIQFSQINLLQINRPKVVKLKQSKNIKPDDGLNISERNKNYENRYLFIANHFYNNSEKQKKTEDHLHSSRFL